MFSFQYPGLPVTLCYTKYIENPLRTFQITKYFFFDFVAKDKVFLGMLLLSLC